MTSRQRYLSTCHVTGKRSYESRRTARTARRRICREQGERVGDWSVYTCEHCGALHLGHRPGKKVDRG